MTNDNKRAARYANSEVGATASLAGSWHLRHEAYLEGLREGRRLERERILAMLRWYDDGVFGYVTDVKAVCESLAEKSLRSDVESVCKEHKSSLDYLKKTGD